MRPLPALALAALVLASPLPAQETPMPEPFEIEIPEETLADLRARLEAARLPAPIAGSGAAYGIDHAYLAELVEYWRTQYDWAAEAARLNALDHFTVEIEGVRVHFVHARSSREDALPLVMLHGWPSSFVQMVDILPLLTEPEDGPAFHVVVPSLIGYGFSEGPTAPGMSAPAMAPLFHALMTEVLGYARYGLRSGDLGAAVAGVMATAFPQAVVGSHTGGTNPFLPPDLPGDLTEEEAAFVAAARAWDAGELAYLKLQATKPDVLGVALNDSPAGLLAWLAEKFWRWTDNDGRIEDAIDRDAFLTNVTLYWATETIVPSMRLYFETFRDPVWAVPQVPVGYFMPRNDFFPTPRSWVERQGPVGHWTEVDQGGHFPEWEEPALVAEDLRRFFGGLDR